MTAFVAVCALFTAGAILLLVWPLLGVRRKGQGAPPAHVAAVVVVALLPIAGLLIYLQASNWDWRAPEPAQTPVVNAHDLKQVVAELQQRLARQPDDVEGWKMLGRSAAVLGDYALARTAFGEANTRTQGRDAEAIAGYAESLVLIDEREIDGHAADLFEQALKIEPDNPRALWYGGITAFRRGDLALAQQRWVELQNHDLPPDLRQVVAERLSEVARAQGGVAPAASPEPAQATSSVALRIDISPEVAGRVTTGSQLFVIARRGDAGPPLAVVRRPVGNWPLALSLTDADAMMPGIKLADGGPIRVIARISRSGQPSAASGDLYGEVGYDFSSASPVNVNIDRIVP